MGQVRGPFRAISTLCLRLLIVGDDWDDPTLCLQYLSSPITEKETLYEDAEHVHYGISAHQGWRKNMVSDCQCHQKIRGKGSPPADCFPWVIYRRRMPTLLTTLALTTTCSVCSMATVDRRWRDFAAKTCPKSFPAYKTSSRGVMKRAWWR
jgi:hypothetical protein